METNELTPEQKEQTRAVQLGILNSESTKNLYIASAGRDVAKYGESGKQSTQFNYLNALSNPDEHVGKLTASPFLQAAISAQEKGRDMYESGAVTPIDLLRNAKAYYISAINKVKVQDVLNLMGIGETHEKNISVRDREMYMEDFKVANEKMYGALISTYFGSVESEGVGEAIKNFGAMERKTLETILKEDPTPRKAE